MPSRFVVEVVCDNCGAVAPTYATRVDDRVYRPTNVVTPTGWFSGLFDLWLCPREECQRQVEPYKVIVRGES